MTQRLKMDIKNSKIIKWISLKLKKQSNEQLISQFTKTTTTDLKTIQITNKNNKSL